MKKFILPLVVVIILSLIIYQAYFNKPEDGFSVVRVEKGNIVQEVSDTGKVKRGEKIRLGFKSLGVIEDIYVEVGDIVIGQDILAKLDNSQLNIQLAEANANLALQQAQFTKLLTGSSQEDIKIAQTKVANSQVALDNAKKALADVAAQGNEDIGSAYGDAINVLDDSYIEIFDAKNEAETIQTTYFNLSDQEGVRVRESKDKISTALEDVKPYLDSAKINNSNIDIDTAILAMKAALEKTSDALTTIREATDTSKYKNVVSSADKSSLDSERDSINTSLTSLINNQQTISITKIDNTANINIYQAKIDSSQGQLNVDQDQLMKITAGPRQEDIDLYQAQVRQASARTQLLKDQISDTLLKSPIGGQIIGVNKRKGELVQSAADDVIVILPTVPFEIEINIYEEDIVGLDIGDSVDISLVAFPDNDLTGKVISVDPAEKIIDGVVYYEVLVGFDDSPSNVKSGMTADLIIKTDFRNDVLAVPEDALKEVDGKIIVEVLSNTNEEKREVSVGMRGTNDLVEILSGLSEGEEIILR